MQMNITYTKDHKTKKTNYAKPTPYKKLKARTNPNSGAYIPAPEKRRRKPCIHQRKQTGPELFLQNLRLTPVSIRKSKDLHEVTICFSYFTYERKQPLPNNEAKLISTS